MSLFGAKKAKKGVLVFIIEDNQMYAKVLQHYLQAHLPEGSEVKVFPVGETAVMGLNQHPDFIVMDYFLDTKWTDASNGVEMAKEIRKQDKDVHILILSAQKDIQVVLDAVKMDKCSYMEKNDQAPQLVLEYIKKSLNIA